MMGQCLEPPKPEEEEKEQPTMPTFPAEVQELIDDLNAEQMQVFKMVFSHLLAAPEAKNCPENGGGGDEKKDQFLLMLHGEAGSGKTHLYKKICKAAEIMVIGTIICASTGIAASGISKCKTVHFTFGLPIFCTPNALGQKEIPDAVKSAKLLIIDEISMLDCKVLNCVDQKLRKFCAIDEPFAGKAVIIGGDRMQLVPPSGSKNSVYANLPLMELFQHKELRQQMRQAEDPDFTQWLRNIGTGQIKWIKITGENVVPNLNELIKFVYGEDLQKKNGGLIIAPTNRSVNNANEIVLEKLEGVEERFEAEDTLTKELNPMEEEDEDFSKIPSKTLKVKSGCIVMLLKNLSVDQGLANGTRLIYHANERSKALICKDHQGKEHYIPRITMNQRNKDGGFIRRRQFPLRLAYATTIHKGQSQTVERLGIYMPEKSTMFAEGMPYSALSRLRRLGGLRIFAESGPEKQILLRNKCSPFALATVSEDGKWIPAPPSNDE